MESMTILLFFVLSMMVIFSPPLLSSRMTVCPLFEVMEICSEPSLSSNKMVIDSVKNSLSIDLNGDFTVNAKGKITLKSTMDMSLESTANAKLKGMQLAMEGTAKGELKAPMVSVNGSAQTEVKGGAMVQVQGAIVKIN